MKQLSVFFLILLLFSIPLSSLSAQGIKPDIRNYDVFVDSRDMPTHVCFGKTPEQWISEYIGYNELAGDKMKFSQASFDDGDQLVGIVDHLEPFAAQNITKTTMDEPENKPTWVGSICYYQPSKSGQIIAPDPIIADDAITTAYKKNRFGHEFLDAAIGRNNIPLTGGVYNMQKKPLEPDPQKQSKCPVVPPGVNQKDKIDAGLGQNTFDSSFTELKLDVICTFDLCACAKTDMYIRTDSTIQYDTYPLCQSVGCTKEQVNVVDPQSQADQKSQSSGGWINGQAVPGLMGKLHEEIVALFGDITGKVAQQQTKNKVNEPVADSSYYTTKALEVGMDFLNCKLYPLALRDRMPECNTNWLANLIGKFKSNLQGPASQTLMEPNEATPAASPAQTQ